jgi:hypothetical protein
MKIDLISMILNNAGRRCFDGAIINDEGKQLDAAHSLDYMIMEYAKVRNGGESSTVVGSRYVAPNTESRRPQRTDDGRAALAAGLDAWARLPHDAKNATSRAVFIAWHENINIDMTTRCNRVAAAVLEAAKAYDAESMAGGANDA